MKYVRVVFAFEEQDQDSFDEYLDCFIETAYQPEEFTGPASKRTNPIQGASVVLTCDTRDEAIGERDHPVIDEGPEVVTQSHSEQNEFLNHIGQCLEAWEENYVASNTVIVDGELLVLLIDENSGTDWRLAIKVKLL